MSSTSAYNRFAASAIGSPSATGPASKSIHPGLRAARPLLLAIFTVGAGAPNGVPRPVVNSTICAPAAVSAVADTRSFPGPYSRLRPCAVTCSPYPITSATGAVPPFCTHPHDLSSSVVMPPFLFPGDGFSYTVSLWLIK